MSSRTFLRVISTKPKFVKPKMWVRVLSARTHCCSRSEHLAPMLGIVHVNEVHDDDAAHVPQAQLPGDFRGRFQVRLAARCRPGEWYR